MFLAVLLRNEKSGDEKIAKIEWKLTEDGSFEIFQAQISCIAIHDIWGPKISNDPSSVNFHSIFAFFRLQTSHSVVKPLKTLFLIGG